MINEELILNANVRSVKQIIHATQGENGSRTLEITMIGTDGEILNLDGCTVSFYVSKNDGKIAMLPAVVSGSTANVTLTKQACTVAGDNDCWIQIVKASETSELRVDNLVLRVQSCNFDGAVESSSEFSALGKLISDASEAIENANTAAEEARTTAATTATNTVNAMKGQPNGIASISASGKLQQMPTAADVGAIPSTDRNKANGVAGLNASGKVMQMPAAIADYVVEQGKNGTWTYRKWESGVAECWGAYTVSLESMDTGISGVSGRSGKITLPSGLFSGKPTAASVAVDWYYAEWETISISSASELSFRLYGNNNSGTIGSIGCNPYVIGRWK